MLIQETLRAGASLDDLRAKLGLVITPHPSDGRVIFNYHQIESPKRDPIARECRGLVLDKHSDWKVVARAFPRFFRYGEVPEEDKLFNWKAVTCDSKEDGSLLLMHHHQGKWDISTRGSFADGSMSKDYPDKTFRSVFYEPWNFLPHATWLMSSDWTYVFEFCTPYNKVVRAYSKPSLYLLAAFRNEDGQEMDMGQLDYLASGFNVYRPMRYTFTGYDEIMAWLDPQSQDPTFEGVVVRDDLNRRIKIKHWRYDELHNMWNNGHLGDPRRLLPFVMRNEREKLIQNFPELADRYDELLLKVEILKQQTFRAWDEAKDEKIQKEFALKICKATPMTSILFEARKLHVDPRTLWPKYEVSLQKHLKL